MPAVGGDRTGQDGRLAGRLRREFWRLWQALFLRRVKLLGRLRQHERHRQALQEELGRLRQRWELLSQTDRRLDLVERLQTLDEELQKVRREATRFHRGYAQAEAERATLHDRVAQLSRDNQALEMNRGGLEALYRLVAADRDQWKKTAESVEAPHPGDPATSDPDQTAMGGAGSEALGEAATSGPRFPLSDAHRGHLSAAIRTVGESLEEIHGLILAGSRQGLLRTVEWDLPLGIATEYLRAEAALRVVVAGLIRDLDLTTDQQGAARIVGAHLSSVWEILEDLRPEKLRAYGHTNRALAQYLGPQVERALEAVRAMRAAVERPQDGASAVSPSGSQFLRRSVGDTTYE